MKIKYILWIGISVLLSSCIDEIIPKLDKFENSLVVEGQLTNQPGPYTIKLSTSASLNVINLNPVQGAKVSIQESGGESEVLQEIAPGEYQTSQGGIRGTSGKRYKLEVITSDGSTYETPFQTLLFPTPIDTIEAEVETKFFPEEEIGIPGYQFYLKGGQTSYNNDFYLWIYEETFKYASDYEIHYIYDERRLTPFNTPSKYKLCFKTSIVHKVSTYSTLGLSEKKLPQFPLHFVRTDNKKLSIRYSLLLNQYSIDLEAYTFWQGVEAQTSNLSSLYTKQPYQLRGNLKNVDDPDEPVLGYFMVAGLSQKRVFVNPPSGVDITPRVCGLDYEGYPWIFGTSRSEWPIYVHESVKGRAIAGFGCMDCRELGGVLEEPDFW